MAEPASMTGSPILNAIIFAVLGIVVFTLAFSAVVKLLPFDVWKEIVHEHNVAAGIVAGAIALGLGWIIAAVMH